jgi:peptide deformylase
MVRKIIPTTDQRLRIKSKPVKVFDKKITSLAKDLEDTLKIQKDPEGVGLSACQIGKNLRIFAMVDNGKIRIIANPKIISISKAPGKKKAKKKAHSVMEGCLSVPNYYGPLTRSQKLTLSFQDINGKEKKEIFEGFSAQIIQHEVDHLNGVLFVDHLLAQNKPLYEFTKEGWEEVDLL